MSKLNKVSEENALERLAQMPVALREKAFKLACKVYEKEITEVYDPLEREELAIMHVEREWMDKGIIPPHMTGWTKCVSCGVMPNYAGFDGDEVIGCPWCHSPHGQFVARSQKLADEEMKWREECLRREEAAQIYAEEHYGEESFDETLDRTLGIKPEPAKEVLKRVVVLNFPANQEEFDGVW